MHPKKKTVGVRIPDHVFVQALLAQLGEPLLTSTLILPGEDEARTMGWEIKEDLDHEVDLVVEAGETPAQPTTVVDWSEGYARGHPPRRRGPGPLRAGRRAQASARAGDPAGVRRGRPGTARSPTSSATLWWDSPDSTACTTPSPGSAIIAGRVRPTSVKTPSMISGGSTPTVKKSRGAHPQRDADAERHEAQVEEEADPPHEEQVEHHGGQRHGDAERDDLAAGLVSVLPERARPTRDSSQLRAVGRAHSATVFPSASSSAAARRATERSSAVPSERAVASTCRGEGSSSSVTARSVKRRAATSTRDSSEPTAWL